MKKLIIAIPLFFIFQIAKAQELLTVKQAIEIALENNYQIKLAKNEVEIATTNVTRGNAGILPQVSANLTQNNNLQNTKQTLSSGDVRDMKNAQNNSLVYGVSMGWTIFDGLAMFRRYDILKENQKREQIELQRVIITQVSDIITTYYTIVEQLNVLDAIDSSILISQDRFTTAEHRLSIGKTSRLEVLNAQVNLNADESERIRQVNTIKNLKVLLNSLMNRDLMIEFEVDRTVVYDENITYESLLESARLHNPDLQMISINKNLAELELKRIKANRYPTLRLNLGYNFSQSESSIGFATNSNSRGLNYGMTIGVNIFDGFNQRRNEQIAKLQIKNSDIMMQQQDLTIRTAIASAFQTYQTHLQLVKMEEKNQEIAKLNLDITLEKFKIGTISAAEFRDAQENYINAIARYNAAKLQAKLSELQMKEIVGQINLD